MNQESQCYFKLNTFLSHKHLIHSKFCFLFEIYYKFHHTDYLYWHLSHSNVLHKLLKNLPNWPPYFKPWPLVVCPQCNRQSALFKTCQVVLHLCSIILWCTGVNVKVRGPSSAPPSLYLQTQSLLFRPHPQLTSPPILPFLWHFFTGYTGQAQNPFFLWFQLKLSPEWNLPYYAIYKCNTPTLPLPTPCPLTYHLSPQYLLTKRSILWMY